MHTRHEQESARQQHVYEGRPATSKEIYGNSANQHKEQSWKVHSVGFNCINMDKSDMV